MNTEVKKYRLGNQPEEYELSGKYLDWKIEGFSGWLEFHGKFSLSSREERPSTLTLVSPDEKEKVALNLYHWLNRDAFPMSLYREERAKDWWIFLKVSVKDGSGEKFVIPMYPMT